MLDVLGAVTCEDTAIVRSRLDSLGVGYRNLDVDEDPAALERVRALNGGHRITPTVVAGDVAVAEPSLERLGELIALDGGVAGDGAVAEPTQLHGDITAWPIPLRERVTDARAPFSLRPLRGRHQVCLFLGHDPSCLACFGYARQLTRHRAALDTADATLVIVADGSSEAVAAWRHGLEADDTLVADADGAWHAAIAGHLGLEGGSATLVLLDRFLAPRVVATASEAGGLPDPTTAIGWFDYLVLECPECSGELPWPTSDTGGAP